MKWITASLLLIYFVFTSGMVFKISTDQGLSSVDAPYSFALSGEDTGIVGIFNEDDVKCAKWLVNDSNQDTTIIADINGIALLGSMIGDLDRTMYKNKPGKDYEIIRHSRCFSDIDSYDNCYIFVTSWNTRHQLSIEGEKLGAGLRVSKELPKFDYPVVYKSGQAVVYLKKTK